MTECIILWLKKSIISCIVDIFSQRVAKIKAIRAVVRSLDTAPRSPQQQGKRQNFIIVIGVVRRQGAEVKTMTRDFSPFFMVVKKRGFSTYRFSVRRPNQAFNRESFFPSPTIHRK